MCGHHLHFSNIKAVTNMRFSSIRSEPSVIKPIPGPSFVNDTGLIATNMTRYLVFNRKLQVIYRGKHGGLTVFLR